MPLDYSSEPQRSTPLIVRKDKPFNAEPQLRDLVQHYITPEPYLFCRSHGPLPRLPHDEHQITVNGYAFTVGDFKTRFKKTTVLMAMQASTWTTILHAKRSACVNSNLY
ncbi:hypothetical protein BCR43DRAFT_492035 [Syncephalastrum racemosum]|uniref:Uncharacterized protein n=1 Tax=Syncephalastrum racemosum TaxID=13706 RepID=A0A1X2HCV7_SYNRA|nr:hypothetical protein BCR43DRAFT_492035 [Syncephalastrum racemosum]